MPTYLNILFFFSFIFTTSCQTRKLNAIVDLPSSLKEVSAVETIKSSNLIWVIEDAGNKNNLYAIGNDGSLSKTIEIENAQNIDWEDLTSDRDGNLYIGDFGNNARRRTDFSIYKIKQPASGSLSMKAEIITFELPKKTKSEDFESFFILNNTFYIFSKNNKKTKLFRIPNETGHHVATYISEVKLKEKRSKVTAADISDDGKTVILLNHERLWSLTNFTEDNFFNGKITAMSFDHNSQKEGVNFYDDATVLVTDEKNKHSGGKLYMLKL
ncbi:MAG: hypothetical protein WA775_09860 [Psychroserpens sp.]|uniref:hypothetical protein n=1 Tax=Psychroserpens sp. TaxID=2020870 RepID=UPI003C73302C